MASSNIDSSWLKAAKVTAYLLHTATLGQAFPPIKPSVKWGIIFEKRLKPAPTNGFRMPVKRYAINRVKASKYAWQWAVHLRRSCTFYSKFFSDNKYGGKNRSLAAAIV